MISSRTPEGDPYRCPLCDKVSLVEPSYPTGDACCPNCGQLLEWFRDHFSRAAAVPADRIKLTSSLADDLGTDSLDVVELVMELEETFEIDIAAHEAERIQTVADAIRLILRHRRN